MKNRLVVMVFTFLLMIAVTPLVFGKLMNSKFNKMLQDLQNQGIELKEIKDKSSYIQTDKIFEVKIPGKLLNNEEIKYVEAIVETKFKNLPVTTVDFNGSVKRVELVDFDNKKINDLIKGKIKFFVTTPNFRVYTYKIMDNTIKDEDLIVKFKNVNGVYSYPSQTSLNISLLEFKLKDKPFDMKIKNIKNLFDKKENSVISYNFFDVNGSLGKFNFYLNKFVSQNELNFGSKYASLNVKWAFKALNVSKLFILNEFLLNLNINGLDKEVFTLLKESNKKNKDKLINQLFNKGFSFSSNLSLKNFSAFGMPLGFLKANLIGRIKPTVNFEDKIKQGDYSFIKIDLNITTSSLMEKALESLNPFVKVIFAKAKHKNNIVIVNIKLEKGELKLNGQKINLTN